VKTVFVAGSRRISRLGGDVRQRLDEMVRRELPILVGDANGADKALQSYFAERHYSNVTVYCTGADCRNNVGNWPIQSVAPPHRARDFAYFTAKDFAMAEAADVGLMLWDGQSSGTMVNVARLVARGKPSVVYLSPAKAFHTLKSSEDLVAFFSAMNPGVREKVEEYISEHVSELAQAQFF
jgi:hypothetical protein